MNDDCTTSKSSSSGKNLSRKVKFSPSPEIHDIPTEESSDKGSLWYNIDGTFSFKTYRFYGHDDSSDAKRRKIIANTLDAVLDEQINQWESGVYDAERIANQSRKLSAESQVTALLVAMQDLLEAHHVAAFTA